MGCSSIFLDQSPDHRRNLAPPVSEGIIPDEHVACGTFLPLCGDVLLDQPGEFGKVQPPLKVALRKLLWLLEKVPLDTKREGLRSFRWF